MPRRVAAPPFSTSHKAPEVQLQAPSLKLHVAHASSTLRSHFLFEYIWMQLIRQSHSIYSLKFRLKNPSTTAPPPRNQLSPF